MVSHRRSNLRHAGVLERRIAWFIDGIASFVVILVAFLPMVFLLAAAGVPTEAFEGIGVLVGLGLFFAYYAGSEAK